VNGTDDGYYGSNSTVTYSGNNTGDGVYGSGDTGSGWEQETGSPTGGDSQNGSGGDNGGDTGDDGGGDIDPVILNLTGGQISTTSVTSSTTYFDMQNNGQNVQTAWMTAGEGMLVYDPSNPNTVTNETDLVGGFGPLSTLDSNHDDVLNAQDSAWTQLQVLVDTGGSEQLFTLAQLGITSINLNATAENVNQNGNTILADSTFTWANGSTGDIAGVALQFNPASTSQNSVNVQAPVTHSALVDHQLNQLIAGMASFNPQSAANMDSMHTWQADQHVALAMGTH